MSDEFADIWQDLTISGITMSPDEIKVRASRLRTRLEREARIAQLAMMLTLVLAVIELLFGQSGTAWFAQAIYFLWVAVIVHTPSFFKKDVSIFRRRADSEPATISMSCIEFYRSELQGRLKDLQNGRSVAPWLMVATAMFGILGQRGLRSSIPAGAIGLLSLVLVIRWYRQMRKETPQVQSEIDDLDARAGGNLE